MGLFDVFGKKKAMDKPVMQESLDLPPPPQSDMQMPTSDVRIVEELPQDDYLPQPPQEHYVDLPTSQMAPPMPDDIESGPAPTGSANPLFVSVADYQQVLGSITYIRNKLAEADGLAEKLNTLKSVEHKQFEAWRNQLEDLQRKLSYVEDVIFAAE